MLQYARLLVCITNEKFGSSVGENELEPWQHRVLMDLKLEGPGADRTVYLGGDRSHARLPVRVGRFWVTEGGVVWDTMRPMIVMGKMFRECPAML